MSLEQFTYSYIFKISQPVYYTMNQLYMICTSTKFVTNKTKSK